MPVYPSPLLGGGIRYQEDDALPPPLPPPQSVPVNPRTRGLAISPVQPANPTPAALDAPQQPSPDRQRLAQAIMNATGGGQPQQVEHPLQAIGNASQQIAAAYLKRKQGERNGWGLNPTRQLAPRRAPPLKPPLLQRSGLRLPPLKPTGG